MIRWGVRALSAINQTTVPWCSVIVRNCYGVGGLGHQPVGHLCVRYAWPSASWGSLPLEGGIEAAYRAEIDAAEDRQAKLEEIEARLNALRSPLRTAEAFWVEEIIDPRDTRRLLTEFANLAAPLRTPGPVAVRDAAVGRKCTPLPLAGEVEARSAEGEAGARGHPPHPHRKGSATSPAKGGRGVGVLCGQRIRPWLMDAHIGTTVHG